MRISRVPEVHFRCLRCPQVMMFGTTIRVMPENRRYVVAENRYRLKRRTESAIGSPTSKGWPIGPVI